MPKSKVVVISLLSLVLSGCSVVMAASESEEPDLSVLRRGTTRARVEKVLDKPIISDRRMNGTVNTYQYFTGDEKSVHRAAFYALLDILTVGFAEVFTTPVEALQGDKHVVVITYDLNDRLRHVKRSTVKAPLPKPERLVGLEPVKPEKTGRVRSFKIKATGSAPKARLAEPKQDEI